MRSADERIEILEKTVRTYRLLVLLTFLLLVVTQRYRLVGWIDHMESWFGSVASARVDR